MKARVYRVRTKLSPRESMDGERFEAVVYAAGENTARPLYVVLTEVYDCKTGKWSRTLVSEWPSLEDVVKYLGRLFDDSFIVL